MTSKILEREDFDQETLKSSLGSINSYPAEMHCSMNIIDNKEFKHSRDVLGSKRKFVRQKGNSNLNIEYKKKNSKEELRLYKKRICWV